MGGARLELPAKFSEYCQRAPLHPLEQDQSEVDCGAAKARIFPSVCPFQFLPLTPVFFSSRDSKDDRRKLRNLDLIVLFLLVL